MEEKESEEILELRKKYRVTGYDLIRALFRSVEDGAKKPYKEYIKDEWLKRTEPD